MGADDRAVVDPELRVRGIEGLRVADASVFPLIPSPNIQPAALMVGERCADLVADRRPAKVEGGRVDEVAHGRSSKVSRSAVRPRATRNESFEVFSSSRRTR